MPWYALYTRPRHEKKVDQYLKEKKVQVYLPLITQVHQWKDRKKKVAIPLFSSYIFANFEYKHRFDILETDGVVKVINFNGKPAEIPAWQIDSLQTMLECPETVQPEHYVRPGQLVEVTTGPMKGMRGQVLRRKGNRRLVLSIDGILQSVSVEVSEADLMAVEK